MDEIILDIKNILKPTKIAHEEKISVSKEKSVSIKKEKFIELKKINSNKKIAFIDGGNAQIMGCSAFSIQSIKAKAVYYLGKKRIDVKGCEFTCLASFSDKGFLIKTNPVQKIPNSISNIYQAEEEKSYVNSQKIANICGYVRRLSEINLALEISGNDSAEIIVLDGSLESFNLEEKKIMEKLESSCIKNNILCIGLSKSTGIISNANRPISFTLNEKTNLKTWLYLDEEIENNNIVTGFIKLNDKSDNIFRLDLFKSQKEKVLKEINDLLEISSDPVFLGYPYGLIDADEEARISETEIEEQLVEFIIKFGEFWPIVEKAMKSTDSHKILDKIRF